MTEKGIAAEAIVDLELFHEVVEHRKIFFRIGSVDYETMTPGQLHMCPDKDRQDAWGQDYAAMKSEMFYGEPPVFDEVISKLMEVQNSFNKKDTD